MTYSARELSAYSGEPVELYDFIIGTTHYRYTSADADIEESGNIYTAVMISRGEIVDGKDFGTAEMSLTVPYNHPIAELYKGYPLTEVLNLTINRFHRDDTELVAIWLGRVLNAAFSGSECTLTCEPVSSSVKQVGLRRRYGPQCPHVLYGAVSHGGGCGLLKEDFVLADTVTSVTGVTIEADGVGAFDDNWFKGGYMTWAQVGGITERRSILAHIGTVITLNYPIYALSAGNAVSFYPGCAHNMTDCNDKFNNLDRYGGWPYVPSDGGPGNGKTIF